MKTTKKTIGTLFLSLVFILFFSACKDTKSTDSPENMEHMEMNGEKHNHSSNGMTNNQVMQATESNPIILGYLQLKNSLVADDGAGASEAARKLLTAFQNFDASQFTSEQQKEIDDIIEDATTQAEHIVENADKIAHQREHFVVLSTDIIDFIGLIGTEEKLYQDFCPMANDNKGAVWLSETREIKNPYLGSKMLSCGSVQKEF